MKNAIKRFGAASLCVLLIGVFRVHGASDPTFSWYCKRNKEHQQPIADTSMQWIERYGGYYVDHRHGDTHTEKVVYLTFDAGYENGNVEKILNVMKQEGVTGAFFVLSHLITSHPELIQRMVAEGHIVANHTANHKDMTKIEDIEIFRKELESLHAQYRELTGREMAKYYRPPEGKFDETSLSFAHALGYQTIFWSLAYADWDNQNQPTKEAAMHTLRTYMHNGAVILLHPTSATNAAILGDFIRELKANGYRFGTLDELTQSKKDR